MTGQGTLPERLARVWSPFFVAFAVLNYFSPRTLCWHIRKSIKALGPAGIPTFIGVLAGFFWHIVKKL